MPPNDPKQLEELLTYCIDFAKKLLQSYGEFHPFGAEIDSNSTFRAVGASNGQEKPPGAELAKILMEAFKKRFSEKGIVAAALAVNANIPQQFNPKFPDGIRVTLESENYSRNMYLPYKLHKNGLLKRLSGQAYNVDYDEIFAVEIAPYLNTKNG